MSPMLFYLGDILISVTISIVHRGVAPQARQAKAEGGPRATPGRLPLRTPIKGRPR